MLQNTVTVSYTHLDVYKRQLIKSRDGNGGSNISMLLNLTDGMLGESIGVQVICTFNTHMNNIDKALLRKGRLIASYEFKELQANKSQTLLESLGTKNYITNGKMTLSDIYNVNDKGDEYCKSCLLYTSRCV